MTLRTRTRHSVSSIPLMGEGPGDAPDKLVPLVRDEVDDGAFLADAEEVAPELDADKLEGQEAERARRRLAEDVGVKRARLARDDGREEDVRDDGHD